MIWRVVLATCLTAVLSLFALSAPHAQFNGCPAGFCNPPSASSPSFYTGPGDVVSGAAMAYLLRAYNAADRGNKLVNVCNSTGGIDVACADMVSDASTGALVPATIGLITCPGANCTIKIWYDRSGANKCSGPCDQPQTTVDARALLTANAVNGNACAQFTTSSQFYSTTSAFAGQAQPYSYSAVFFLTNASAGNQTLFGDAAGNTSGPYGAALGGADQIQFYAGSGGTISAVDFSKFISLQVVANGASSNIYYAAASNTVNSGTNALPNANVSISQDNFGNHMDNGYICEMLIYPIGFSGGNLTGLAANQTSFFGPF